MTVLEEVILRGLRVEQPATPPIGSLYFVTDEGVTEQYTDPDGWVSYTDSGQGLVNPMTDPSDIIVGGIDGAAERLGVGADGTYLAGEGGGLSYMPFLDKVLSSVLTPGATDDLGAVATPWRDGYFSGTVNADTIDAQTYLNLPVTQYTDDDARGAMLAPAATDDIGTTGAKWRAAYFSGTVRAPHLRHDGGNLLLSSDGHIVLQENDTGNQLGFQGTQLYPLSGSVNLGSGVAPWLNAYFSGTVYAPTFAASTGATTFADWRNESSGAWRPLAGNGAPDIGTAAYPARHAYFSGSVYVDGYMNGNVSGGTGALLLAANSLSLLAYLNAGAFYSTTGATLGNVANRWADAYVSGTVNAPKVDAGAATLSLVGGVDVTVGAGGATPARFQSTRLRPNADADTDLGHPSYRWKDAYFSGTVAIAGTDWTSGTGTPEAAVTAPVGSMYTDSAGGAGTTLYVKESGTGNTGWVAK